jgi:hypothetical protein
LRAAEVTRLAHLDGGESSSPPLLLLLLPGRPVGGAAVLPKLPPCSAFTFVAGGHAGAPEHLPRGLRCASHASQPLAQPARASFCAAPVLAGIVDKAADLDVAMVMGMGFPAFRGGLIFWADLVGAGALRPAWRSSAGGGLCRRGAGWLRCRLGRPASRERGRQREAASRVGDGPTAWRRAVHGRAQSDSGARGAQLVPAAHAGKV